MTEETIKQILKDVYKRQKQRRARSILGKLVDMGVLERLGAYRNTVYTLKNGRKK